MDQAISRRRRLDNESLLFEALAYTCIVLVSLLCFIPFLFVISGSLTAEKSILRDGFNLIPRVFSTEAYKIAFAVPETILRAYGVTIFITFAGTLISLFLMSMTSYALSRKDFTYRNGFSFFFYFTTIFSGGIVPWYILMVRYLGMKNNILALILPGLFNVFYMIIIRSFMNTIPDSISESAKCDGASDFRIFIQIILPLSKPALATMGLFTALSYWNDWYNAMLFIERDNLVPLQFYLYKILSKVDFLRNITAHGSSSAALSIDAPAQSFKMAMTVITTGPIILLYPYIQKYFIQGIMIGAVKG